MSQDTSPDAVIKLERAFQDLEILETMLTDWLAGEDARVRHKRDGDEGDMVARVHIGPRPPDLGVTLGQCLHHARSSLDNLAYALTVAHSGDNFTDAMQASSEFPIFWERPMTAQERQRKIGGIHPEAQRIIESLQPHHVADYTRHPLWQVHELDRINKHRALHVVGAAQASRRTRVHRIGDREISQIVIETISLSPKRAIPPGGSAEVARYRGYSIVNRRPEMYVPIDVRLAATFGDGPLKGRYVAQTLRPALEYLRDEVQQPLLSYL
jgi:hypothetical protein